MISLALSFWMKHLVIGQLQKPAKFSAFHWSTSRSQAFIGQLLETSRVVHLPKRTVMVLFTISDAELPYRTATDLITESDKAVRAVHSCKCWCFIGFQKNVSILKNRNLPYLFHGNNQGISSSKILVVLTFSPSSKRCKRMGNSRTL